MNASLAKAFLANLEAERGEVFGGYGSGMEKKVMIWVGNF